MSSAYTKMLVGMVPILHPTLQMGI